MDLRTKFIDYDARREPKTNHFCVRCQRDLKPGQPYRSVHLVHGGPFALHPGDEQAYTPDAGDMGWFSLGLDCARKIGLDWTHTPRNPASQPASSGR